MTALSGLKHGFHVPHASHAYARISDTYCSIPQRVLTYGFLYVVYSSFVRIKPRR